LNSNNDVNTEEFRGGKLRKRWRERVWPISNYSPTFFLLGSLRVDSQDGLAKISASKTVKRVIYESELCPKKEGEQPKLHGANLLTQLASGKLTLIGVDIGDKFTCAVASEPKRCSGQSQMDMEDGDWKLQNLVVKDYSHRHKINQLRLGDLVSLNDASLYITFSPF
jgi:hypothetical protein